MQTYLKKRQPAKNMSRFYRMEVLPNQFGEWTLYREWGRIGQGGQVRMDWFADEDQALWADPYLIEAPANVTDEPRFLAVGMIGTRHWTAVYTYRSDRVRIISVRRARKQEIDHYEDD